MLDWLKKKYDKNELLNDFVDAVISDDQTKSHENFQKIIEQKIKEIEERNNPFWH